MKIRWFGIMFCSSVKWVRFWCVSVEVFVI